MTDPTPNPVHELQADRIIASIRRMAEGFCHNAPDDVPVLLDLVGIKLVRLLNEVSGRGRGDG